jgi:hypothetical protein
MNMRVCAYLCHYLVFDSHKYLSRHVALLQMTSDTIVVIAGLANSYSHYTATFEEYQLQVCVGRTACFCDHAHARLCNVMRVWFVASMSTSSDTKVHRPCTGHIRSMRTSKSIMHWLWHWLPSNRLLLVPRRWTCATTPFRSNLGWCWTTNHSAKTLVTSTWMCRRATYSAKLLWPRSGVPPLATTCSPAKRFSLSSNKTAMAVGP